MDKVTYVANAGVLLEAGSSKIMIDGLCNTDIPIYKNTPEALRNQIVRGIPPFDKIDLLLFTHHHADHFDPESTCEYLKYNSDTVVISTAKAISDLKEAGFSSDDERLVGIDSLPGEITEININGISVKAIATRHDGRDYDDVLNLAFLVETGGRRFLHVGDAKPLKENFKDAGLAGQNIDLLIAPFPYVGLSTARSTIESFIRPQKIMAIHMPYRELDSEGWISSTLKSYKNVEKDFFKTEFVDVIGSSILL